MVLNVNGFLISESDPYFSFSQFISNSSVTVEERIFFDSEQCKDFERHYFGIMTAMRIYKRRIPMEYTPEFIEEEIKKTIVANKVAGKVLVHFYASLSESQTPLFLVALELLKANHWTKRSMEEIDLFKEFYWSDDFLSGVKTPSSPIHSVAQAYCTDHGFEDCFILNARKEVVMTLNGFVFLRFGNTLKTPSEKSGVYRETLRGSFIESIKEIEDYTLEETEMNPFDVQRADELIIISPHKGLIGVERFRKTTYSPKAVDAIAAVLH